MESAAERDDHRPAGRCFGELDGRLDGLRAGIRQEEPRRIALAEIWEALRQQLVQLQTGLVVQDVLLGVDDVRGLVGDRRRDAWMGVAGARHADPRGVVEVPIAADRLDP